MYTEIILKSSLIIYWCVFKITYKSHLKNLYKRNYVHTDVLPNICISYIIQFAEIRISNIYFKLKLSLK